MTSFMTDVTRTVIATSSYQDLTATFGVIGIVLLIFLLVQKEVLRALTGPRVRQWMQVFDVAVAPLLLAFGLIVAMRLVTLLVRGLR